MRTLLVAALISAFSLGGAMAHEPKKVDDNTPKPTNLAAIFGGSFNLTDHTGEPRSDADFKGQHLLIYFGYTHCPDICPLDLATVTDAMALLESDADKVQPLFITVDPARDTPEVLANYVPQFHPRLIGLTGSEHDIRGAAKAYRVHRSKLALKGAAPSDYLANHSSLTYLMDKDGGFITLFPHSTAPEKMAETISKYLKPAPS